MYKMILLYAFTILTISSSHAQAPREKTSLSPQEFSEKIKESSDVQLVDVRTPEEYNGGHIENAINIDWMTDSFSVASSHLDKQKPVLVYCLSGGRSADAAGVLRKNGFTCVYEMKGGMMKWRAARLPEVTTAAVPVKEMTTEEFNRIAESNDLVLINFYTDWCRPCKQMKPYLEKIAAEEKGKVTIVRINVDQNKSLCYQLRVSELPALQWFKKGALIHRQTGLVKEEELRSFINQHAQ